MSRSHPDDFGFSLIQSSPDKQLQLEKMRAKLAGNIQGLRVVPKPKQTRLPAVFTTAIPMSEASSWGWKILLTLSIMAANGAYFFLKHEETVRHAARRVPKIVIPAPAWEASQQALYWTYALYDFNKLTSEFGVPAHALVDFGQARANLEALLPKVDPVTRQIIEGYLPHPRKKK